MPNIYTDDNRAGGVFFYRRQMWLFDRNQSIRFRGILVSDAGTSEIEAAKSTIEVEAKKKKTRY